MAMGLYMGGPAGMAASAAFTMASMTVENLDYSRSVADQIGNESAAAAANRSKGSAYQKKLRSLGQQKQNIIDQLNQRGYSVDNDGRLSKSGVSQASWLGRLNSRFDVLGGGDSNRYTLARQYKKIVDQQKALTRSAPKKRRLRRKSTPAEKLQEAQRAAHRHQWSMMKRSRKRMSDADYWKSMDQKDAKKKSYADLLRGSMTAQEYNAKQTRVKDAVRAAAPTPRAKGSIFGGRENLIWTGQGPMPKARTRSVEEQMILDEKKRQNRAKHQAWLNQTPGESMAKTKQNWENWKKNNPMHAGGYVPNFQGINDAIKREIRDGGVSSGQVRVHFNPDAVTNTRDEPRGLKDVPNFAGGEQGKQMLSLLKELVQEIRENNQVDSAEERKGGEERTSGSTVNHNLSPLNINVSGSIQETNSNIDQEIFNAVVKAVEKLRGGMPVAPPKAGAGE